MAKSKYLILILAVGAVVGCIKAKPPPLIAAISARDYDKARELILSGVDVNARMPRPITPFHEGRSGFTALQLACAQIAPADLIDLVLDHGADVNIADTLGLTPLDALLYNPVDKHGKDYFHILEALIGHGVRTECLQAKGASALRGAVNQLDARELKILLKLHFSKPVLRKAFEEAVYQNEVKSLRILYDTLITEKKMKLEDIVTPETAQQVREMLEEGKDGEGDKLTSSLITSKPVAQASSLHPL